MDCLVAQAAQRFGDSPAIIDHSHTLNYHQYNARVAQAAARLRELGVMPASRVGIVLPNSIDQVVLLMALIRIGATTCPISSRLPLTAVESCLRKVDASLLIVDHRSMNFETCRVIDIGEITGVGGTAPETGDAGSLEQPAVVIFTSGSTGEPKAALLTLGNLYYNALGSNLNIAFEPEDRWLLSLPLYHVGGLGILFRALAGGGAVVIDDSGKDTHDLILHHDVTHLSLVSTQLYRLITSSAQPRLLAKQLKAVLLGGSAIPSELIRQSVSIELPIHTSYGLTEMASQVTTTPPSATAVKLFTSGHVLPHRQLRLSPSGEIELRGETRCAGYVDKLHLVTPFDSEGWFRSGDIGAFDADNYLTVLGRVDTMFISGGENIHPEEIEKALYMQDGIVEAVVVPVPHREYGLRPCAFVRVQESVNIDVHSIREQLRDHLPSYKLPDRIFAWPSGVVSAGFKPDRVSLQKLAERLCR